ncbi:MAG TPA: 6-phosphogluconolactonase [Bryobacteraceae bacterium]|nr:6-phosphogluconolactonase [Bryobacteraceae bacterium]
MRLHRYPDAEAAAQACAAHVLDRLSSGGNFAISGGSSPRRMFEIFGQARFDWSRVHLFWVDERVVPATDAQSNYKLAFDAWLSPAHFPSSNIHRVQTELGPREAARVYIGEIRRRFGLKPAELPRFDLIHRGIGPDGHTASLFPGEPLIADAAGIAAPIWVEKMSQWRVTLLPGVLEAARHTVMLVVGADKTAVLREVLEGQYRPSQYPAQIASRRENCDWFLDAAAAAGLSET